MPPRYLDASSALLRLRAAAVCGGDHVAETRDQIATQKGRPPLDSPLPQRSMPNRNTYANMLITLALPGKYLSICGLVHDESVARSEVRLNKSPYEPTVTHLSR